MADRFFPLPFAGMKRQAYESGGHDRVQKFYLDVNGESFNGSTLEEPHSWQESYRLPTGRILNTQTRDPLTGAFQHEAIRIEGQPGSPSYSYARDSRGMHFYRQEHAEGPRIIIGQRDFLAGVNSVVGAYDAGYARTLALAFTRHKTAPQETIAIAMGEETQLRITMDAHAALVQHVNDHLLFAYFKGGRMADDATLRAIETHGGLIWGGSDWSPDLQTLLARAMPDAELQSLRRSMQSGRVSLEVVQADENEVCRAIMGRVPKGGHDAYKNA